MFCTIFLLQIVTNYLTLYFSNNIRPYDLFAIKNYGRIAYQSPPPTPQVCYYSSADYADEYYLLQLTNVTNRVSPPLFLNNTDSFDEIPLDHEPTRVDSSLWTSSLPKLLGEALQGVGQMVSWIFAVAVVIFAVALQVLAAIGPQASAAYVLCEQKSRDLEELKMKTVSSLVPVVLAGMVDRQGEITSELTAKLRSAEEGREHQRSRVERFDSYLKAMGENIESLGNAIFENRAQTASFKAQIADLEVNLQTTFAEADKRQRDQAALFTAKSNSLEDTLQTTITDAKMRFDEAQHKADQRILELQNEQEVDRRTLAQLEGDLEAARAHIERLEKAKQMPDPRVQELEDEQLSDRNATAALKDDLKQARTHIQSLLSTISSNARELQMYRAQHRAQRQAQQAGYPEHRQPFRPTPPPPQPMGYPHPPAQFPVGPSRSPAQQPIPTVSLQRQSPFAARHSPLGFPPNRTRGFMGNAAPSPPQWGRGGGGGAGAGSGSSGGAGRGIAPLPE
ncbi:hypothetical protein MMC07_006796 [Pseudocyphellaria aurata]|nr:hypothetical protein [Pseudocyphellaria aurata]